MPIHPINPTTSIASTLPIINRDPATTASPPMIMWKFLSRIILGSHLKDINAGFRCITNEASKQIDIKYKYNFVNPEIFSLAIIKKLKITEKVINHHPREGGRSELSGIKNIIYNSVRMIKYMFDLKNEIKKLQ